MLSRAGTCLVAGPGEERLPCRDMILVVLAACIPYVITLWNGLVWDDDIVILTNQALQGAPLDLFRGIDSGRTTEITPYYRPLTLLTFLVEGRLHGFQPFWMHGVNLLLHMLNALLVLVLAERLGLSRVGGVAAALLFAVHPINAETVNFISGGRNTMLAGLFSLLTIIVHQTGMRLKKNVYASFSAICLFVGLLCKETALMSCGIIVWLEFRAWRAGRQGGITRALLRGFLYLMAIGAYFVLRSNALELAGDAALVAPNISVWLANNFYIIPRYALNLVWPFALSPQYSVPDNLHLFALPLAVGWLGILVATALIMTKSWSRITAFGLFWLGMFWLPVSGIVPIPSALLADRYFYLPIVGICLVAGDQLQRHWEWVVGRRWIPAVLVVVLMVFIGASIRQSRFWHDDIALFTWLTEISPNDAFGHNNLGCAYMDKAHNLGLAEQSFARAFALNPDFPRLRTSMDFVEMQRGFYDRALEKYSAALLRNPVDAEALLNHGIALERLGRLDEAIASYRRFVASPGNELPEARRSIAARLASLDQVRGQ